MEAMEPTRPTTVPQPLSGMVDPTVDLASIADPWEQRVTAISLVTALRAARQLPHHLFAALPPVEGVAPFIRQLPSPDEFRRAHLPQGKLLTPQQVDGWIHEQALRDGNFSWRFVGVWVHEEEIERKDPDGVVLKPGTKLRFDPPPGSNGADVMWTMLLEYVTPLGTVRMQAVRGGSVLDTLRLLSLFYKHLWEWTAAQGTIFVLTGLVPYADTWAQKVAMQHGRRPRPMSLKHLELGVFAQRYSGEGLARRMARWNDLHPDWAYNSADQFSSDSARALRRMGG
jgi:hypothetical protein